MWEEARQAGEEEALGSINFSGGQSALAKKLGVSQPRVVKLESGEHNPEVDTIINAVRRLGIEFVLDISPTNCKLSLVTARAQKRGTIDHDEVSVVVAASA